MVQKLESVLVDLVHGKLRALRLLVEINEAGGTRLELGLVVRVHCAELCWVYSVIVQRLLSLAFIACLGLECVEPGSGASIDIFRVFAREVLLVAPNFVEQTRTALRGRIPRY